VPATNFVDIRSLSADLALVFEHATRNNDCMNMNRILRLVRPLLFRRGKSQKWAILVVALVVGYGFLQPYLQRQFGTFVDSEQAILAAFENHQSDVIVHCDFKVVKNLRDDMDGDKHQKMLLQLPSGGHTVLLAHNIDLAPRVPAAEGDTITVRGEYEYSEKGGVVHWTHHDPRGRHEPGWIEHEGKRYE